MSSSRCVVACISFWFNRSRRTCSFSRTTVPNLYMLASSRFPIFSVRPILSIASAPANHTDHVLPIIIVTCICSSTILMVRQIQPEYKCVCRLAMESCDALYGDNRADCYASFGCDVERVDTYLGPALRLEADLAGAVSFLSIKKCYIFFEVSCA